MFLTKKSLAKIRLLTGLFYLVGAFCFAVFGVYESMDTECKDLAILGILSIFLGIIFRAAARYSEGKGNLIISGNKLVLQELRPAQFIKLYEEKQNCADNVIARPDFDVLQLLATAYDALGDADRSLETLDQMFLLASKKKKTYVKLLKSSILFNIGKDKEADVLYREVLSEEKDWMTKATLEIAMKCDRAIAIGDFITAEAYTKEMLSKTAPKPTPLSILYAHFNLAKIYYLTHENDEAKLHLNYCVENGGETGVKQEAVKMLNDLNAVHNS